jgi:hypothetical protein
VDVIQRAAGAMLVGAAIATLIKWYFSPMKML